MSVAYGSQAGGYAPPGRVNYDWIGQSWRFFGQAAGIWILAVLLYGIVSNVVDGIIATVFANPGYVAPPGPFGGMSARWGVQYGTNSNVTPLGQVLAGLFTWAFASFQSASLYRLAVKQVRGEAVSFGDAVGGGPYFVNMLVLTLLVFILSFLGVLAACLGVFVVAGLTLPASALVADGRSAVEAISQSFAGMKQDWLNAALFIFVFSLLVVASVIPCGLGLFVTIPMLHIVGALAYRDMIGMPGIAAPASPYGAAPYGMPQAGTPGVWPPPPGQAPPYGQPPAPSFGQPPAPSFGQPPPPSFGQPPPAAPPRRTLGGDPLEEDNPPRPNLPPGGPPPQ